MAAAALVSTGPFGGGGGGGGWPRPARSVQWGWVVALENSVGEGMSTTFNPSTDRDLPTAVVTADAPLIEEVCSPNLLSFARAAG